MSCRDMSGYTRPPSLKISSLAADGEQFPPFRVAVERCPDLLLQVLMVRLQLDEAPAQDARHKSKIHTSDSADKVCPRCTRSELWNATQIGRAHVGTQVPTAHIVCRLLLEKKEPKNTNHT